MNKDKANSLLSKATSRMTNPIKQALSNVLDTLHSQDLSEDEYEKIKEAVMVLFIYVIRADGTVNESEIKTVINYFRDNYGPKAVSRFRALLQQKDLRTIEDVCALLEIFSTGEKERILNALLNVAYADGEYQQAEQDLMKKIASGLGISDEVLRAVEKETERTLKAHSSLMKSSAGLIAAFVIIVIFILTATYLKSVLFGLILAYFFLPLQGWYGESFFNNGFVAKVVNGLHTCTKPFAFVIGSVRGLFSRRKKTISENLVEESGSTEDKERVAILRRSCHAAVLSVVVSGVAAVFLLTWVSSSYFTAAKQIVKEVNQGEDVKSDAEKTPVQSLVDKFNPHLKEIPLIKTTIDFLDDFRKDEKKMNELVDNFKEKHGGTFGIISTSLGGLVSFLLNLLLTLFFFSFFLDKMAQFQLDSQQKKSIGDYLVESIFDSGWLPKTTRETQKGAAGIIDVIAMKLQTWVRGYLWIIIIESAIYITLFLFLGVPYAVVLGSIAGLTVLLPFLGPLASVVLTLLVCAATGDVSPGYLGLIVGVYFIMNMIVEQLFLYPAFVGEALGLNILETIAVVLLGGLLAGLAGVIFAVPAASILKYLIPKVYRTVSSKRAAPDSVEIVQTK